VTEGGLGLPKAIAIGIVGAYRAGVRSTWCSDATWALMAVLFQIHCYAA